MRPEESAMPPAWVAGKMGRAYLITKEPVVTKVREGPPRPPRPPVGNWRRWRGHREEAWCTGEFFEEFNGGGIDGISKRRGPEAGVKVVGE
jgi:hypothetical protein